MQLLTFGINHETAPVEVRELAAFAPDTLAPALADIRSHSAASEAAILSTCNRTELYCNMARGNAQQAIDWFCDYLRLPAAQIQPYIYQHCDEDAVKHTFRVAAGLNSMVLGEPQILGQMKEAFAAAHKIGATGKILNRLFQQTFAVAKQVRTDTAIGVSAVSVAFAAVSLAKQIFDSLSEQTVLLVGAGEMIELTARHLHDQKVRHMIVANRTVERAQLLAEGFQAEAISLTELPMRLADADIVISSTASPLPILGKGAVERALKIRKHRPIFMVDMAVPRDIESEVGDLDDVYLYTVDDLQGVVQENLQSRMEAAREAETIIDMQAAEFMHWLRSLEAVPTIRALRENIAAVREAELKKAQRLLARGEDPQQVLASLAHALTNKITHHPTTALRKASRNNDSGLLEAARKLFKLGDD